MSSRISSSCSWKAMKPNVEFKWHDITCVSEPHITNPSVIPKGNQSWKYIGRADAKAETSILWPTDAKGELIGKDPDAGKDWRQEEKGTTEDEMVGWHHQLNEDEFEQTLGDGKGQGSLACCSLWGSIQLDTASCLNNSNKDMEGLLDLIQDIVECYHFLFYIFSQRLFLLNC